ncbi:MAG: TetR/AcrR family transcriptional regulator [Johnsonella sp.]|nr:TetR/AcrR family transcriptional regulator [Johnsonella sp.]
MPKSTFLNLSKEKRRAVIDALIDEFEARPLPEATVAHIIEKLGIARGSFYQYFESLTESYFYVLQQEIIETHALFLKLYQANHRELIKTLEDYGCALAEEIFQSRHYALYKNRYLYWTASLEKEWRNYLHRHRESHPLAEATHGAQEMYGSNEIQFVKALIHSLIQRLFLEEWDADTFLKHYRQYIRWIKGGIYHV